MCSDYALDFGYICASCKAEFIERTLSRPLTYSMGVLKASLDKFLDKPKAEYKSDQERQGQLMLIEKLFN